MEAVRGGSRGTNLDGDCNKASGFASRSIVCSFACSATNNQRHEPRRTTFGWLAGPRFGKLAFMRQCNKLRLRAAGAIICVQLGGGLIYHRDLRLESVERILPVCPLVVGGARVKSDRLISTENGKCGKSLTPDAAVSE